MFALEHQITVFRYFLVKLLISPIFTYKSLCLAFIYKKNQLKLKFMFNIYIYFAIIIFTRFIIKAIQHDILNFL